jgi:hypothetical protein
MKKRALGKVSPLFSLSLIPHRSGQAQGGDEKRCSAPPIYPPPSHPPPSHSAGSTIIPLYDPRDWETPLATCLPSSPHQTPLKEQQQPEEEDGGVSELSETSSICQEDEEDDEAGSGESSRGWIAPPRRRQRSPDKRFTFSWPLARDPDVLLDEGPRATSSSSFSFSFSPAEHRASPSARRELVSPEGVVDSRAVYLSLFNSEQPEPTVKTRPRTTTEPTALLTPLCACVGEEGPLPSRSPEEEGARGGRKFSVVPFPVEEEEATPTPRPKPSLKKKPSIEKPPPVFMDPQVALCAPPTLSSPRLQYRLLLARKMAVERDPVLNFLIKTRPSDTSAAASASRSKSRQQTVVPGAGGRARRDHR